RSATEATGTPGWVTRISGILPMRMTGAKSLIGSNGTFFVNNGLRTCDGKITIKVEPSAGERATTSAPITPLAPALFSTTTVIPNACSNRRPIPRANASTAPPAVVGTIIRTVLCGYRCAVAWVAVTNAETRIPIAMSGYLNAVDDRVMLDSPQDMPCCRRQAASTQSVQDACRSP